MKIEYYSNGCGTGKTRNIKEIVSKNIKTEYLIIVPSVALASEYQDVGTVITGTVSSDKQQGNVQKRILEAHLDPTNRVLVITQKAFTDSSSKRELCTNRTIIQDEELKVVVISKWKMNNHKEWMPMFKASASGAEWFSVDVDLGIAARFVKEADDLDELTPVRDLLATPYDIWSNNNKFDEHTRMFKVIKPDVYKGANNIIIACANFEQTFQFQVWRNLYKIEFECNQPFLGYKGKNTTLHFAEQKINSITYNKGNTDIRDKVVDYIKLNAKDAEVVAVDNNRFALPKGWSRVEHNCHGVNEFRHCKHVAILSALNLDNVAKSFFVEIAGMEQAHIRFALMGETAHQIAMRGVLRTDNDAECHIYIMEQELAHYLKLYLLEEANLEHIPGTERAASLVVRKAPISQVDRNKANHVRKVNKPLLDDIPAEDLMDMYFWKFVNSRGKVMGAKDLDGLTQSDVLKSIKVSAEEWRARV